MKSNLHLLALSLLLLASGGCGKKAQVKGEENGDKTIEPSVAEVYFNALKEIRRAVYENDLPALMKAVKENPNVDLNQILNDTGETFLTTAIRRDFRTIRNFLIDKGVSLERVNVNKETPLMVAVANGMANSVRVLIDQKVDLEKRNAAGDTALHIAIKKNMDEIGLILIKQGANVDTLDARERNSLRLAQEYNVPQSLVLIESITKLELGAPDLASFRSIILQADSKRLTNVLNRYPRIASDRVYEAINPLALLVDVKDETNAIRSAELLINYQANVNGPLDADQTPLIRATVLAKKGFANLFLSSKANPQLQDKDGKSALIHAVELNNPELVDMLLTYSANEKYTFRKDGKKITYNACDIARSVEKTLKTPEEKAANEKIKEALDCGFLRWLF